PHNLWPPRTGAHKRGLQMLSALRDLGAEVTLASSPLSSDTPWEQSSVEALQSMISHVCLYEPDVRDRKFRERLIAYYQPEYLWLPVVRRLYPLGRREPPLNTRIHTPPGLRRWFNSLTEKIAPDAIVMNYPYWDRLIDHRRLLSSVRIIDTIDLVSLNG